MSAASKPKNRDYPPLPGGVEGTSLPVAGIKIGNRHRRDMGDIDALAQNIAELGLLHSIVVTPTGELIAGERRLLAYRKLRRERIPARVLDLDQIVRGEYAENFFRKSFTPSEYADIADALETLERQAAKERQKEHGGTAPGRKQSGEIPHSVNRRALDRVARAIGKDRKTITKAREVRDAARAEPERFGKLAADMDRTGRVDGPHKRLKVARQAAAIRAEPPPFPGNGPYRVMSVDPPLPYDKDADDPGWRATYPYPQMSIAEICAMGPKVREIAHEDCILWLWTPNHHMREAFVILDAWGFRKTGILTWAKDCIGRGEWLRGQTEHCLMAVRGNPTVELTNQSTLLCALVPRDRFGKRDHSAKPDEFYALVEGLCPAPRYAELFQRKPRDRWNGHGDELQQHALAGEVGDQ
jgi:N6-adenosine-specific RNA methylase IME4